MKKSLFRLFHVLLVIQLFGSWQLNANPGVVGTSYPVDNHHSQKAGNTISEEDNQDHIVSPVSTHVEKAFKVFIENTEEAGGEQDLMGKDLLGKVLDSHGFYTLLSDSKYHNSLNFIAFHRHSTPIPHCRRHLFLQVFRI